MFSDAWSSQSRVGYYSYPKINIDSFKSKFRTLKNMPLGDLLWYYITYYLCLKDNELRGCEG